MLGPIGEAAGAETLRKGRRRSLLIVAAGSILVAVLLGLPALARADDGDLCLDEIAKQETKYGMPDGLLRAIARVESSGSPYGPKTKPWPWTLNVGGAPHYYPDKASALLALTAFKAQSNVNIDVGCMQISLRHHPNAFPDLATALDPVSNVQYGALFLSALHDKSGDWLQASGDYHSTTPGFGDTYRNLVQIAWSGKAMPKTLVNQVRATVPDGPAIISIAQVDGQMVIRRLDTHGQPIGSAQSANGLGGTCDHSRSQPGMAVGQGVRVWSGLCDDPPGSSQAGSSQAGSSQEGASPSAPAPQLGGYRITIPDTAPADGEN
jgi:hypothetical protein